MLQLTNLFSKKVPSYILEEEFFEATHNKKSWTQGLALSCVLWSMALIAGFTFPVFPAWDYALLAILSVVVGKSYFSVKYNEKIIAQYRNNLRLQEMENYALLPERTQTVYTEMARDLLKLVLSNKK